MYNHLNCVAEFSFIPTEAFLFKPRYSGHPDQPDDFKRYEGEKFRRLLFQGWAQETYTPLQKQKLAEFQIFLKEKKIVLDPKWDNPWRLRFLISTNYQFEDTVRDMQVFVEYMGRVQELSLTHQVQKNLRDGLFYIAGRDCHYRPILVFDAQKIIKAELTQDQCLQTQVYFFQYVMRHYFIPGQVESWVALIDSAYQGFFSLIGALQKSFQFLANTYRMRLYCCYNVRINFPIRLVWGIVQKFLDAQTVNKINLVEDQIPEKIFEHTNRSQIEVRFGGTLPNIKEGCFWPPQLQVSKDYKLKSHPVQMMTPEQYTYNYDNKILYDTKIQQELLIRKESTEFKANHQKKIIRQMQKQFERSLQITQEERFDPPKALLHLPKFIKTPSYSQLLLQDKEKSKEIVSH